jgi:prepilin-type N-terminal cleavage/methylation domain-containing protein
MIARRGFTLIELVVALVVALLAAGVTHGLLLSGQRHARAGSERAALYDNVRTAAHVIAGEIGPLGYDELSPEAAAALGYPAGIRGDLLAMDARSVTYLAGRGHGTVCAVGLSPAEIRVEQSGWTSARAPKATDSLLAFAEGDPAASVDNAWLHLGVLASAAGVCPDGGAAIVLRVAVPPPLDPVTALGRVSAGAVVQLAEVMQLRYYESGGEWWLGLRSVASGEAITPVAGPLADSTASVQGLTLSWLDAAGAPTLLPDAVRAVDVALVGISARPIHTRHPARAEVDTFALSARIALRNAPAP